MWSLNHTIAFMSWIVNLISYNSSATPYMSTIIEIIINVDSYENVCIAFVITVDFHWFIFCFLIMHIFLNHTDGEKNVNVTLKWRWRRKNIIKTFYDPNFCRKVLAFLYYFKQSRGTLPQCRYICYQLTYWYNKL